MFRPRPLVALLVFGSLFLTRDAFAQGTKADYDRSNRLWERCQKHVFRGRVEPHWFADDTRCWYRNDLAGDAREFVLVDAVAGSRTLAFDHDRLARVLSALLGEEILGGHLPISNLEFGPGDTVRFACRGKGWKLDQKTYALTEEATVPTAPAKPGANDSDGFPAPQTTSPDGRYTTLVKGGNLILRDHKSRQESALSTDGAEDDGYAPEVYWSPDGKKIVAVRTKAGDRSVVHLIESAPLDRLQPKLHTFDYLKPGDRIPLRKPHLFDVAARKEIPIPNDLFPNPWEIDDLHWEADSRRFTFLYNQRGHQVLRIVAVDAVTGEARALVEERSKTFIDWAAKRFIWYLDDEIIWMSERDGWNHLYLYDAHTGAVKNQITRGQWVVRGVDGVDEKTRQIWFRAGGVHPEQDPYYIHHCRVNFDGGDLTVLTDGDGSHTVHFSPERKFFVDSCSRVDMPPVTELRCAQDGRRVCVLERADASELLATGYALPERFVTPGRDGKTGIYGVIFRPTTFDPARKYPVIEYIYAGPQDSHVPKQFHSFYEAQATAELGFIVVQIDGMGTSNRSKAFHDVCWKNLADAGFPDRIPWIQAAAKKYPYMDLSRGVGIYGGSAGGQNTLGGLLSHPEFYKVGVADCGCHDNRMDKIWWNELYMGWPVGLHYKEQSNVTNAHKLQGKLLLLVGELDHNVDPATTMQVVDALIKADKDFDLLVVPGHDHGTTQSAYVTRRERDFFVRHLLGVEPRRE